MSGKIQLNHDTVAKELLVGGVPLDDSLVRKIESFSPPTKDEPYWKFCLVGGDKLITDGVIMFVWGKNKNKNEEKTNLVVLKDGK